VSDRIVDWVFPVVTAAQADGGIEIRLQGTGFLLAGGDGLAITARHVARALGEGTAGGMFCNDDDRWRLTSAAEVETHPREDVAWLRLVDHSSGKALPRPDLIYREGYVRRLRRRMTGIPVDSVNGHNLFELSAVAGGLQTPSPAGDPPSKINRSRLDHTADVTHDRWSWKEVRRSVSMTVSAPPGVC